MVRSAPWSMRRWAIAVGVATLIPLVHGGQVVDSQRRDLPTQLTIAGAECIGLAQPTGLFVSLAAHRLYAPAIEARRLDLSPWLIEDKRPVPTWQENASEATAYDYVLSAAQRLPVESLARAARRDLTFAHFFEEPDKHRGEIVHVEGFLKRIRRFEPGRLTRKEGVHDLYEGWLFQPRLYGAVPMCLVFTELPAGLHVGESLDAPVTFDGFFFKRYRYEAAGKWRDAPLLIGRRPVLTAAPATPVEEGVSNNTQLILVFLAVLVGTLFFALGLAWWYHRGDRRVRARLTGMHAVDFVDPSETVAD